MVANTQEICFSLSVPGKVPHRILHLQFKSVFVVRDFNFASAQMLASVFSISLNMNFGKNLNAHLHFFQFVIGGNSSCVFPILLKFSRRFQSSSFCRAKASHSAIGCAITSWMNAKKPHFLTQHDLFKLKEFQMNTNPRGYAVTTWTVNTVPIGNVRFKWKCRNMESRLPIITISQFLPIFALYLNKNRQGNCLLD